MIAAKQKQPQGSFESLQSHKVEEEKWPIFHDFGLFSWPACSLKVAQLSNGSYFSALMLRLCPCLVFVAVAATRFEVESHKVFFQAFPPPPPIVLYWTTVKICDRTFVNMKIRLPIVRSLRNSRTIFSTPDLSTHLPLMLQLQCRICLAKMETITRSAQPFLVWHILLT